MLFIYYRHTGEIYQASIPEKNLTEFFGEANAEIMSTIFDYLYIEEFNSMIFYNFKDFTVSDGKLIMKNGSGLQSYIKF